MPKTSKPSTNVGIARREIEEVSQNMVVSNTGRDGPVTNDRRYLSVFTKSKIWSVSNVSAVLIE
jgi:hypothetical protein